MIADYRLPHFSAPEALELFQQSDLDLPFIVVSGAIGEETAIATMKAGAHDYLMKGNLKRLTPAIERELNEAEVRRQRRQAEEALQQRTYDLGERVKELNCLYGVSSLIADPGKTIDAVLNETVNLIPQSFQYPEITCVRIGFEGREFASANFRETPWGLIADIVVSGGAVGELEVCYLEERPALDEGPFLDEERNLINDIARQLGVMIEHRRAEEKVREKERYFRSLMYSMHEDILVIDRDYVITDINNTFLQSVEKTREEVIGKRCHEVLHGYSEPCARHGKRCVARDVFETGKPGNIHHVHTQAEGSEANVHILYSPMKDEAGNVTRVVEAIRDMTDLMKAHVALRQSEEQYRDLYENAPCAYFSISAADASVLGCNSEALRLLGHDRETVMRMKMFDLYDDKPQNVSKAQEVFKRLKAGETIRDVELQMKQKDGHAVWISLSVEPMVDRDGNVTESRSIVVDINDRKKAEEELVKSEKKYRTILESIEEGYYEVDLVGNFTFLNDAMCRIRGSSRDELMGMSNRKYMNSETAKRVYKIFNEVYRTGKPVKRVEWESKAKDGTINYAEASVLLMKDSNGQPIGFRGIVRDVSERKRLEAQLLHAQKMESIGTLAGGVAHDFNNILTTIIGNASLAVMKISEDDPLREEIEDIREAGERAASLTRQLLAFSRKQIIHPKVIDLNELLTDIEKMLGRLIGEDVELLTIPGPELWQVEADPGQIEQVVMNLVVNAKDAMPRGGKLTVETANVDLDRNYFRKHGIKEKQTGTYVMLVVSDTGIGMDKKTQEHIFEPFFTTKEVGKGTGLGLSTVYGIVKQNNGFIWVYSEPGQGSTFKIYLPKVKGDAEAEEKERISVENLGGSETVLIVEDDDSLRKLARTVLKQRGYKVLEAENGEDALRVSEAHDGSIDLLITDVVMPKMGGKEVAERLQPLYPQMKVIYMSGYTDNAIVHHGVLAPGLNFFEKPFTPESLALKVREVLDK